MTWPKSGCCMHQEFEGAAYSRLGHEISFALCGGRLRGHSSESALRPIFHTTSNPSTVRAASILRPEPAAPRHAGWRFVCGDQSGRRRRRGGRCANRPCGPRAAGLAFRPAGGRRSSWSDGCNRSNRNRRAGPGSRGRGCGPASRAGKSLVREPSSRFHYLASICDRPAGGAQKIKSDGFIPVSVEWKSCVPWRAQVETAFSQ
jgi:hypothetical protein